MIRTPSKYLQRHFLRDLKNSYYVSKGGKEYFPSDVDQLLQEKESRLALSEYNRELRAQAEFLSRQPGIDKGSENTLSSNDAPNFICADTIFPLKELPKECFPSLTTAPVEQKISISRTYQPTEAAFAASVNRKGFKMNNFKYKNHLTVSVLHENYSLNAIRNDLKRNIDRLDRITKLLKNTYAKPTRSNQTTA